MSALDIPPHPRRTARLALGVLALIAAAGFAEGFLKQLEIQAPPGPPPTGGVSAVAEATPAPAPALQVMEPSRPHRAAPPPDLTQPSGLPRTLLCRPRRPRRPRPPTPPPSHRKPRLRLRPRTRPRRTRPRRMHPWRMHPRWRILRPERGAPSADRQASLA